MDKKDLFMRFLLGGAAVSLSYLITIVSPWKILAGIFAAFPAVMLTAVIMVGIGSGSMKAGNVAKGSVYGMMGGLVCVVAVLSVLEVSGNWALGILIGLASWLGSSIAISFIKEHAVHKAVRHSKRKVSW
jgi:hypothetical protein